MSRGRNLVLAIVVLAVTGLTFGLVWFQPWKLIVNDKVNEALPAAATEPVAAATAAPTTGPTRPTPTAASPTPTATPRDVLLARGSFISHEHSTHGTASVVRLADGSRVLAISQLRTSNGPLLKVWLTDQRVTKDGWHVFDDGRYVNLGGLKGNIGNQVYRIPADADLSVLHSVTIWCDRFDVSFGAAELLPVPVAAP